MNIEAKINYRNPSGSADFPMELESKEVQLWLQEATPDQLVPAFVVGSATLYWYQDKLWQLIPFRSETISAVDAFVTGCKEGKLTLPSSPEDTYEAMYEHAAALVSRRLACDGKIYAITGEPRYRLRWHPEEPQRISVCVAYEEDTSGTTLEFNALQKDLMQKYIRITKVVTRERVAADIHQTIHVLLPEAVKLPGAEDITGHDVNREAAEEAIEELNNGKWWNFLSDYTPDKVRENLCRAVDYATQQMQGGMR